jgi:2-polyprenyl-3-methyl-5-hydroxy-6-metoxy-1,4-benzoquinol methylase
MQPFKNYIPAFSQLLTKVNSSTVSQNDYAKQYLDILLLHKEHYLNIYALVLEKAFAATNNTHVALLDFGTGNGLFALFAKFCGVKEVFASDVSASFLEAAQQLSKQLDIAIDGWIIGDENTLTKHFSNKQLDIVAGTDVIEHVYDLDNLFTQLYLLNSNMITVFTTASVAENPFKSAVLKKLQLKDELEDSNAFQTADGHEFAGMSFLQVRKQIIQTKANHLSKEEIEKLAVNTRGLRKDAIEKAVDLYLEKNQLPVLIKHSTNTCDPITGSWTERLLSIDEYRQLYKNHSTTLLVHCGFYNSSEKGLKSYVAAMLNIIIHLLSNKGVVIAPFIVLEGRKNRFS